MRSAWSAFKTSRTKSRSRICSTPPLTSTARKYPGQTTTSSLPRASCAICWKARAILRATFKSSASPAPRAFCCATWQKPIVHSTAPCPSRSATSACTTLSRGWALWCARSTRVWWTSGRTPATPLHSTPHRRRASTKSWQTAVAVPCWCATHSSAAWPLQPADTCAIWASSTRTGA